MMFHFRFNALTFLLFISLPAAFASCQNPIPELCTDCYVADVKDCRDLMAIDLSKCVGTIITSDAGDLGSTDWLAHRACYFDQAPSGWGAWKCTLAKEERWAVATTVHRSRLATTGESGKECVERTLDSMACKNYITCDCLSTIVVGPNGTEVTLRQCEVGDEAGTTGDVYQHFVRGEACGGTSPTPDPVEDDDFPIFD